MAERGDERRPGPLPAPADGDGAGLAGLLRGVADATRALAGEPDFEAGINRWLAVLSAGTEATRAGYYEVRGEEGRERTLLSLAEWVRPGAPGGSLTHSFADPAAIPVGPEDWAPITGCVPFAVHAEERPEPARSFLRGQGTETVLMLPFRAAGRICAVSFDFPLRRASDARALAVLATAAASVAAEIERRAAEEARLAAERERAEDEARVARLLQGIVAGTRALLGAPEFEPALRDWLRLMCEAQGAVSASYYDVVAHPEAGTPTVRCLADWSPHPPGTHGRLPISFASPFVIDPRGSEAAISALARGEVVAIHTAELDGPARAQQEAQGHATTIEAPIMDGDRWIGAVSFDYWERREPAPRDEAVLRTAADALAAVLKRDALQERLVAEQRGRADENARLAALLQDVAEGANALVHAAGFEPALREWLGRIGAATGAARATYYERAPHAPSGSPTLQAVAEWAREGVFALPLSFAEPAAIDPREHAATTAAMLSGEVFVVHVEDTSGDLRRLMQEQGNASVLHVPVRRGAAHVGGLGLDFPARREFTPGTLAAMRVAADSLASAMARREAEEARLAAERERAEDNARMAALLRRVVEATRDLAEEADFERGIGRWLAEIGAQTDAARASFYDSVAPAAGGGGPVVRTLAEWARDGTSGSLPTSFAAPVPVPLDWASPYGRAFLRAEPYAVQTGEATGALRDYLRSQGNETVLVVPFRLGADVWAVSFDFLERRGFDGRYLSVLQTAANSIAAEILRRRADEARLAAERARADESERLTAGLQEMAAGSRRLMDAADFEAAVNGWLGAMGRAAGAARASFCDRTVHEGSGLPTVRCLAEWTRPGVEGSIPVSFAAPVVLDPRGAEALMAASLGAEIVAFHADETAGPMRAHLEAQGNATVLTVPIRLDGGTRHLLSLDFLKHREVGERERAVLQTATDAMASVLKRREAEAARLDAERARAEGARDAAAQLARRRDLLEAVVAASDELMAADRVEGAAAGVAARIGAALRADRVCIGRFLPPDARSAEGYVRFFAEWTAPGVPRQTDDPALATFDMAHYPDFHAPLRRGEAFQKLTGEIEHAVGRAEQEATGALSQFVYPVMVDGGLWGVLCVDDCRAPREWDGAETATLRLVASALGNVVRRERLAEARLAAERELAGERARMAREIHDTLAQGFTGVIMQMHATEDALEAADPPGAARHTALALERARMGLAEARRSVYALRPPLLDDGDLAAALRLLAGRIFDGVPTRAEVRVLGALPPMPEPVSVELLRIGQEALGNALRHARAAAVRVTLDATVPGRLALEVADDGAGFDPAAAPRQNGGFGLVSMRERAHRLGGRLDLASAPGAGTRVAVDVDLTALAPPAAGAAPARLTAATTPEPA